jgi:hypothetical protein
MSKVTLGNLNRKTKGTRSVYNRGQRANVVNWGYFHLITGLNCAMKKIYKFTDKSTDIQNLYVFKKKL